MAKSIIRTLTGANGERMQINAIQGKSDVSFYILHQRVEKSGTKSKVTTLARGCSARYPSIEEATPAVESAVQSLVGQGWTLPDGPRGFVAQADTFTLSSLPAPSTPAVKVQPVKPVKPSKVAPVTT